MRKCELCDGEAVKTERFCSTHRREMLRKMKESGYLQPVPPPTIFETPPQWSEGGEGWDNVVRVFEETREDIK